MAKKTHATTPGRPVKYATPRVPWCVWIDEELATTADDERHTDALSRPELIEMLLRKWLGQKTTTVGPSKK